MLRRLVAVAWIVCCSISSAHAAQIERVVAVLENGEIQLEKTGKAVFQNTLALDHAMLETWLAANGLQREINVSIDAEDRYGRALITSDVQQKMLHEGIALIYAARGDISANWRAAEAAARVAKRGVWANESLVLTPEKALTQQGDFHVVEGTITRIYEGKDATYLNFGDDWRRDFSIAIAAKQRRSMKAFLANVKAGDRIRVRGSIIEENGPMIRLNHADNLEKI